MRQALASEPAAGARYLQGACGTCAAGAQVVPRRFAGRRTANAESRAIFRRFQHVANQVFFYVKFGIHRLRVGPGDGHRAPNDPGDGNSTGFRSGGQGGQTRIRVTNLDFFSNQWSTQILLSDLLASIVIY